MVERAAIEGQTQVGTAGLDERDGATVSLGGLEASDGVGTAGFPRWWGFWGRLPGRPGEQAGDDHQGHCQG
jgi:hypothetical protein